MNRFFSKKLTLAAVAIVANMIALNICSAQAAGSPSTNPIESVSGAMEQTVRIPVETVHNMAFTEQPMANVWSLLEGKDAVMKQPFWKWRGDLEDKGVVFTFVYTGEFDGNTTGGIKKGSTYLDNIDMIMDVDTEKATGWWWGGHFHVYGLNNGGGQKLSGALVGDLQTASNIEAPRTFKLFEWWYEQKLFSDKLSVLVGVHNMNSEFNVTQYGALFFNSSFGIEPDLSANFNASIFPVATLGTRVKWEPCEEFTLLAGVYDGDPQDPDVNKHGTHIALSSKDGALTIVEPQIHYKLPVFYDAQPLEGTIKGGGWYHSKHFDDLTAVEDDGITTIVHDGNYGGYAILDQMLWREKDDQGLSGFVQYGHAPQDRNQIAHYIGTGINYKGLIPGRDQDTFGLAYNRADQSEKMRTADGFLGHESVIETTYQIQVTPSIVVQPDLQFISHPGGVPDVKDAIVYIMRFKVSF